jgi:Putative MetA-pathway of phenol degradation
MITRTISKVDFPAIVRHLGIASLLLFAANGIQAEEDDEDFNSVLRKEKETEHINDLRFSYSMLPAGAKISVLDKNDDTNPGNFLGDTNWDKTGRTGLMWMTPWSGLSEDGDFILGLEASTNHCIMDSNGTIDLRSYQVTLHPGLAWLLDTGFHMEVNPYVGIGVAKIESDFAGTGKNAPYWEVGLRGAAYYTWSNGIQLGMQLGYMYGKSNGEIDSGTTTFDTKATIQGLTLGIQLGYRL